MLPHLCLGTVQFGLPYGITNNRGQVPADVVTRILQTASSSGVKYLDTAQAYGISEQILGDCWPVGAPRCLISKLPAGIPKHRWEESLITSLRHLQATQLDGYLLHRASDLLSDDGDDLLLWLESLRDRNLVKRIGVSIYDASELENLPLDRLQLVQLPLSIYDQRLKIDGTISELHGRGIAVHVRSVFLQGLILQSSQYWPSHLSNSFCQHHTRWLNYLSVLDLSPIAGALAFVRETAGIEAVLVGVASEQEFSELLKVWFELGQVSCESQDSWAWNNIYDLDPRRWP